MNTYRINKKDLKNKKVLAEGYKIFRNDWSTKHGNYCYADENGNVVGTFHKVDGDIEECSWGLHFSRNPFHCFNFYEPVQWNKFAKVRAYENIIECVKSQWNEYDPGSVSGVCSGKVRRSTFGGDSLHVPFSATGSCRGCAGLTSLL